MAERRNLAHGVEVFVARSGFQLDDCRHGEPPGAAKAATSQASIMPQLMLRRNKA
jgi:hypothetical protein